MAHALLANQEVGRSFEGVYHVESCYVKKTKQNKDYTDLMLRDKSGSRAVKFWGVLPTLQRGEFLQIKAMAEEYMGGISIIAKDAQRVSSPSDLSDYLSVYPDSSQNASMFDNLQQILAAIEKRTGDSTASTLVKEIYSNGAVFQKFVNAPGSVKPHYGRQGGLLANTVRVADQCAKVMDAYGLDDTDRAVLIASALLFRAGAIDAFEFRDCIPTETKRGVLLGVDNLTANRVTAAVRRITSAVDATPSSGKKPNVEVITRILHAIISYSGKAVKPMTREAIILASVYRTDNEMVEAGEFIDNDVNFSEEFTAFDTTQRRRYYTGCRQVLQKTS